MRGKLETFNFKSRTGSLRDPWFIPTIVPILSLKQCHGSNEISREISSLWPSHLGQFTGEPETTEIEFFNCSSSQLQSEKTLRG